MFTGVRLALVLCGDIAMKPSLPASLGNFNISKLYFKDKFCYVLSGRKIRWNYTLRPSFHIIRQLIGESPLMQLIINKSHDLIGCNQGIASYTNHVRMSGFLACNLELPDMKHKLVCKRYPLTKLTMIGESDIYIYPPL